MRIVVRNQWWQQSEVPAQSMVAAVDGSNDDPQASICCTVAVYCACLQTSTLAT